uniref:SGNH hydrolase-type esterase domain-containing protein n=1 Tax=Salarias fasciatus TaxID=181472 RepID=A0A672GPG4_SALFA
MAPAASAPCAPSCSTPEYRCWAEVVVRGHKPRPTAVSPRLPLSNRFLALTQHNGDDTADAEGPRPAAAATASSGASTARRQDDNNPETTPPDATTALHPTGSQPRHSAVTLELKRFTPFPEQQQPFWDSTSAARWRLIMEAVRRHSGSHCRPSDEAAGSSAAAPAERSPAQDTHVTAPPPPRPLFPPTSLIIGDSIVWNIHFFNAIARCFPGATVPTILAKLPELLRSAPSSVRWVIVHIGSNDTTRRHSELTKKDFKDLFSLLQSSVKIIYNSGPLPTLFWGAGRFSRLLSLNTWLQHSCSAHNLHFIDNFNLFWNRPALYRQDGLHPSRLGNSVVSGNIQHAVQTSPAVSPAD